MSLLKAIPNNTPIMCVYGMVNASDVYEFFMFMDIVCLRFFPAFVFGISLLTYDVKYTLRGTPIEYNQRGNQHKPTLPHIYTYIRPLIHAFHTCHLWPIQFYPMYLVALHISIQNDSMICERFTSSRQAQTTQRREQHIPMAKGTQWNTWPDIYYVCLTISIYTCSRRAVLVGIGKRMYEFSVYTCPILNISFKERRQKEVNSNVFIKWCVLHANTFSSPQHMSKAYRTRTHTSCHIVCIGKT